MGQEWIRLFDEFEKNHPNSAKIKTKSKWETKFYELCFKCRKANKKNIEKKDCNILFISLMEPKNINN